jgi:hypothetical protein
VDSVEALGLGLGQVLHLGGGDLQAGLLEAGLDFAYHVLGHGIGLDD